MAQLTSESIPFGDEDHWVANRPTDRSMPVAIKRRLRTMRLRSSPKTTDPDIRPAMKSRTLFHALIAACLLLPSSAVLGGAMFHATAASERPSAATCNILFQSTTVTTEIETEEEEEDPEC